MMSKAEVLGLWTMGAQAAEFSEPAAHEPGYCAVTFSVASCYPPTASHVDQGSNLAPHLTCQCTWRLTESAAPQAAPRAVPPCSCHLRPGGWAC
eukprot:1156151-Pelagomonas_calceolata.AAC.3